MVLLDLVGARRPALEPRRCDADVAVLRLFFYDINFMQQKLQNILEMSRGRRMNDREDVMASTTNRILLRHNGEPFSLKNFA